MKRGDVELEKICLDEESTQQRDDEQLQLFPDKIAEYAEEAMGDPVDLFTLDGQRYFLGDGWLRCKAALARGDKVIPAIIHQGGLREAVIFSCGANVGHGLKRTPAGAQKAIRRLLEDGEWGRWSLTKIASACKVSRSTVELVKAKILEEQKPQPTEPEEEQSSLLPELSAEDKAIVERVAKREELNRKDLEDHEELLKLYKLADKALDLCGTLLGAEA